MTRKEFLQTATGVIAATAASTVTSCAANPGVKGLKRGVSLYCYNFDLFHSKTVDDCLIEVGEMASPGQKIGVEILANAHIRGYPHPSAAWVDHWHKLCEQNHLQPVELGHWVDSKTYNEGPEGLLSTEESAAKLIDDIKLGHLLGFTHARTKLGMMSWDGMPTKNWREIMKIALPVAEKHNFRMLSEVHSPEKLKGAMMDELMDFIIKEKTTPWFGLNIDFGIFTKMGMPPGAPGGAPGAAPPAMVFDPEDPKAPQMGDVTFDPTPQKPEDMIPLLPYVHCCHAKFSDINRDCEVTNTPYREIIKILADNKWDGYLISEYEGPDKAQGGAISAVRRHQVLLKRLLGEA
ncbi:MAG: sugar phosphate isomerase/epimerase [Bryobacterales bacterium]|nr:sugar phosphate isomerase/epimerase [Bryobacterales bacterium]